jgi:hypothetical protein
MLNQQLAAEQGTRNEPGISRNEPGIPRKKAGTKPEIPGTNAEPPGTNPDESGTRLSTLFQNPTPFHDLGTMTQPDLNSAPDAPT